MLGKLFNLGSGTAGAAGPSQGGMPRPVPSLESVHEDIHTRNLLFPDAQALYQHRNDQVFPLPSGPALPPTSAPGGFDYDGDGDLDMRDVRVLVMQDALGSSSASLLFDSHPPPMPQPAPADRPGTSASVSMSMASPDPRRTPTSPRKSSVGQSARPLVIQPDSPQPRQQGAFDRRASMQGRSHQHHQHQQSHAETELQRAAREYREELATFSSCIFGNSELMAYKGTSTKVHVVPFEPRATAGGEYSSSYVGDGKGSVGRSSLRSSRLAQSYSSEVVSPVAPPSFMTSSSSAGRHADRRKVLITRLFPVVLPADDGPQKNTPSSQFSEDSAGFPFPQTPEDSVPKKKKHQQPKQKRTPMYAVVLVIQLPPSPPLVPLGPPRSGFRGPSSYTDQESFPSSFSSARRSGWTMVGGMYGEPLEAAFSGDGEDRIDYITQHWDIIMRTLTHLQSIVATTLVNMLKQADLASPDPYPSLVSSLVARTPSQSGRRNDDPLPIKPPKSNAKMITLPSHCLMPERHIGEEIDMARSRIISGLRATRVVTGQGRWGIWRDEARWMARWFGSKERGFFFFNLMTAFLATHTDWLQALSPPWYRKRYYHQQKAKGEEDLSLPARTIIVAEDKMAARRMIFLLSAFLPANQQLPSIRTHRPSTSASVGPFSQSPPLYVVPILREESLRRKINRRAGPRRGSHSRTVSQSTRGSGVPAQWAHLSMEGYHHERRPSDAASIRTSNLPIPGSDLISRKSSAATTTTVTPETTVAHLASVHRVDSRRRARPGSSGSVAADDLKRTLKRGESTGQSSIASTDSRSQGSRWGSVISGLWSARRRDSTNVTSETPGSAGSGSNPPSPVKTRAGRPDKLAQMVREVSTAEEQGREAEGGKSSQGADPETPRGLPEDHPETFPAERVTHVTRIPDPSGAFESPVKTSINIDDGIIDVDVPFPDYITSFETAVSSPSSSGYLSTPGFGTGLDGFEQSSRLGLDGDIPLNVAGWLQTYHPDFALQAIPPQDDLIEQVKATLRAEPSPSVSHSLPDHPVSRWIDVSSAVIADTVNHTVRRIRYRRLIRPKPVDRGAPPAAGSAGFYSGAPLTPSVLPYEHQLEEEYIEEEVATLDEVLIESVERVIAQTSDASKGSSSSSSRSNSKHREGVVGGQPELTDDLTPPAHTESQAQAGSQTSEQSSAGPSTPHFPHAHVPQVLHEVPRGECKTVVLSALGDIINVVLQQREREAQEGYSEATERERERESVLRSAVRSWLEMVELGD